MPSVMEVWLVRSGLVQVYLADLANGGHVFNQSFG
jgi:hypothetical protein